MISEYKLKVNRNAQDIVFQYIELHYPQTDTSVLLYSAYKMNIMLSDGLAAIMNDRNDIYNTFSGDLLFFGPQEIHHGRILRQGLHKYIEILIPTDFLPDLKEFHALFSDTSEDRTNIISPKTNDRSNILAIAEKLIGIIKNPQTNAEYDLLGNLIELLNISCNLYSKKDKGNQKIPHVLNNAIEFIKKKHSENIQIPDVAAASNCSTSYLSRIFKKHIGKSPYCYLLEYRLFTAEKLLRNGCNVTEAAMLSGFADSSSFIKCFKKSFGVTPFQYIKKERQHKTDF